jgi:hypothetical protein
VDLSLFSTPAVVHPGDPAITVFVPMDDLFSIACDRPKSVNVA